jgi:hypothetical protein
VVHLGHKGQERNNSRRTQRIEKSTVVFQKQQRTERISSPWKRRTERSSSPGTQGIQETKEERFSMDTGDREEQFPETQKIKSCYPGTQRTERSYFSAIIRTFFYGVFKG